MLKLVITLHNNTKLKEADSLMNPVNVNVDLDHDDDYNGRKE